MPNYEGWISITLYIRALHCTLGSIADLMYNILNSSDIRNLTAIIEKTGLIVKRGIISFNFFRFSYVSMNSLILTFGEYLFSNDINNFYKIDRLS